MGLRFRRRLRFGRGVWLNPSKRGARGSVGGHGAAGSGLNYRLAQQTWMSPHAIGTGPIVGLMVIVGMVLLLAGLSGH
jgi:hypothetical protein